MYTLLKALAVYIALAKLVNASLDLNRLRNNQAEELLHKIISNNNNNNNNKIIPKGSRNGEKIKKMSRFLNNLANIYEQETCSSKVLQSNVQSQMRMLRSIISACPGYCRLAVGLDNVVYGAKNVFSLESKIF